MTKTTTKAAKKTTKAKAAAPKAVAKKTTKGKATKAKAMTKAKSPAKPAPGKVQSVPLDRLRTDGGTQPRAALKDERIEEYSAEIQAGAEFPPVVAYDDGNRLWLADGFHRYHAHQLAGIKAIRAEVRKGSQRDAILYSVGANATHGLHRSNDDKRRAVLTLLNDKEWGKWSDREIGRRCAVSYNFVGDLRRSLSSDDSEKSEKSKPAERAFTTKHGTAAKMNTANIGRRIDASTDQSPPDDGDAIPAEKQDATVAESPTPSAPLDEMKDELGQTLPSDPAVHKAFAETVVFDDLMNRLSRIKADATSNISNDAGYLNRQYFEVHLSNARSELVDGRPYAVCPYCKGNGCKGKTGCRGARYVTKPMFDRAPKEVAA